MVYLRDYLLVRCLLTRAGIVILLSIALAPISFSSQSRTPTGETTKRHRLINFNLDCGVDTASAVVALNRYVRNDICGWIHVQGEGIQ